MNTFGADLLRDLRIIIEDKSYVRRARDRKNTLGQAPHFIPGFFLRSELNNVTAALAQLSREVSRIATAQISGVNKGVKATVLKRFHGVAWIPRSLPLMPSPRSVRGARHPTIAR